MSTEDLIIKINFGGLGDHLFHSHIPRIAKKVGRYKRVYLSNASIFRQKEYRQLIWALNPYLDGFCDEDGFELPPFFPVADSNLLDQIMLAYGIDDGKRFHEPEIYYKPNKIYELSGYRVFDPNYISNIGYVSVKKIYKYIEDKGGLDSIMQPRDKSVTVLNTVPVINAGSIYEYCDIISSCNEFYCMTSGGASLAAALGKHAVVFYGSGQNSFHRHSSLHEYVDSTMFCGEIFFNARLFVGKIKRWIMGTSI